MVRRFKEKVEEHGIRVVEVSEDNTSSICPRYLSNNIAKRGRLFK